MYSKNNVILQRETYTDTLLTTKHGIYTEYTSGKPTLDGKFYNNFKHGDFRVYSLSGGLLELYKYNLDTLKSATKYWPAGNKKEETIYAADNKIVEQTIYYSGEKISSREKFSLDGKLIDSTYLDIDGNSISKFSIEAPPRYPGGIPKLYEFITKNFRIPQEAFDVQDRINIKFTITEKGKIEDVKLDKAGYPKTEEEAIRVMKLCPDWLPGMVAGKAVKFGYSVPINFNRR